MLLKKKNGNATENVVALTKEFGRISQGDGTSPFPGSKTFAMKPFVTTKKIYFPGNDPLVIAEHQAYDNDLGEFTNRNYVQTGTQIGYNSISQQISYSNTFNPNEDVEKDINWYGYFNNFINWRDCLNSNSSTNESANYYGTNIVKELSYTAENIETHYSENVRRINGLVPMTSNPAGYLEPPDVPSKTPKYVFWSGGVPTYIHSNYGTPNKFSIIISGAFIPGPEPEEYTYGVIRNDYAIEKLSSTYSTAMTTANPYYDIYYSTFAVTSTNMMNYFNRHPNTVTMTADTILFTAYAGSNNNYEIYFFDTNHYIPPTTTASTIGALRVGFANMYSADMTANVTNIRTTASTATQITGDNLQIHFTSTGNDVTGTIQKGGIGGYIPVTANVTYHVIEYSANENNNTYSTITAESTTIPITYNWTGTGEVETIGGGGGYGLGFNVYPIYANKRTYYPSTRANVFSADGGRCNFLTTKTKTPTEEGIFESIPDSYGGAMIFSGANLTNKFNNSNNPQFNYIYIGFKGIGKLPEEAWDNSIYFSGNFAFKAYKFNSEHFKPIGENTFYFQDDSICNLNSKTTLNSASGSNDRPHSIYGPFFFQTTQNTYMYYKTSSNSSIFTLSAGNLLDDVPTILNTINYITPATIAGTSGDYIITKPAASIEFSDPDSQNLLVNFGNTDTVSYLKLNLPTYWKTVNQSLKFNQNLREITYIGKSGSAFTALNSEGNLTALSSIKDWGFLTNIKNAAGVFQNATALKELPSDFTPFGRLENASYMFIGCSSLSSLPDLFALNSLNNAIMMFAGCSNVETIPGGMIRLINNSAYMSFMFSGCTSLTSDVKYIMDEGNSRITDSGYYNGVFKDCTAISGYNTLTSQAAYKPWFGLT